MWPFSALKHARYNRRYRAAWTLLLAKHTYSTLTPQQQAAVRERDIQYFRARGTYFTFSRSRRLSCFFSDYVIAMKSLGIPPALAGERWAVPDDVDMPVASRRPFEFFLTPDGRKVTAYRLRLVRDYRTFDPATADAQRELAKRGIEVSVLDPAAMDDLHHIEPGGKRVTWREWWRSKA